MGASGARVFYRVTDVLMLGLIAVCSSAAVAATPLAITIDDLPWVGRTHLGESRLDATRRLLETLTARQVPATGFVNCDNADPGAPMLRAWLDAGLELGNHAATHMSLTANPVSAWLEDVARCDRYLRELIGGPVRYFRYPFLYQGQTPEKRGAAYRGLADMGYTVAHVTADNSEWRLGFAYSDALKEGDDTLREQIRVDYIQHVVESAEHAREVARGKVGRDGAHVLLLHANTLGADHLGAALDALVAAGFALAPLDEVLQDPLYHRVDSYAGTWGQSWLYRFAPHIDSYRDWDRQSDRALRERYAQ